jgi:hypothetical protein
MSFRFINLWKYWKDGHDIEVIGLSGSDFMIGYKDYSIRFILLNIGFQIGIKL